jgi:DNA mismatch repair protein MutS
MSNSARSGCGEAKLSTHGSTRPLLLPDMFVDSATLQDLEIVATPTVCGPTLLSLINRTRTRVGSEALRQRLLNPPHTAEDILALQRAHQALAAEARGYRHALDQAAADEVERYLNSNWQLPRDMPRLICLRRWYGQYLQAVERGYTVVTSLLDSAADLRGRLALTDAAILQELGNEIGTLMDAATQELRGLISQRTSAAILRFDQVARESAKSSLIHLLLCVGRLEALWSIGVATSEHGWTYPRPSSRLRAVGLYHPFLGRSAISNDLHLDDQVRVCFVTGPNMAGKSTFLKATAVAVLLAHTGSGVPAASMEFVPVGTVFSSVQIVDNLSAGESFYLAEVRRIGALAAALAEYGSALAVVDEPFRGTNVHDAAEATLAVITRLAAHPAALTLVASHVGEVVPTILADPRIAFYYFAADATGDLLRFDYRLREGVSEQRLGMTLLRQEGVLDRLERPAKSDSVSSTVPETHDPR